LARFLPHWQGITRPRKGLDALLDVVQQLQGAPLPASDLEHAILPARIKDYRPTDLDQLCAAGEVVWRGCESIGSSDGRIALYLADQVPLITSPRLPVPSDDPVSERIHALLAARGALFFDVIVQSIGGFRNDVLDALWQLVWSGEVTNDTLAPLRSLWQGAQPSRPRARRAERRGGFRSRRAAQLPGSEGRWSLLFPQAASAANATERQLAISAQLLERYGVVTREMVTAEGVDGGFSAVYPVLKMMEESGRARRGYFVAGLGAAQFALAGAEDRLRQMQQAETDVEEGPRVLAATDPANPYGAALPWPPSEHAARPARAAGARVILHDGQLVGYLGRTRRTLLTFLPAGQPQCSAAQDALCQALAQLATDQTALLLAEIDGAPAGQSPLSGLLQQIGFVATSRGLLHRRSSQPMPAGR
jgi:ATP-dependent Lhr-like helicase